MRSACVIIVCIIMREKNQTIQNSIAKGNYQGKFSFDVVQYMHATESLA